MIDRLREFAEGLRRSGHRGMADISDELLELLDARDDEVDSYRRIMKRVDELINRNDLPDEAAAMRVLDRYEELREALAEVERFDPSDEVEPGAVKEFVEQADRDAIFRYDVRAALVAFGAVDENDKDCDLLAILRALLEV